MEQFIKNLVRDAGKILKDRFGKIGVSRTKSHPLDSVTEADLLADKLITETIKKKFPTHAIISEESGEHNKNQKQWIIDPLDGTNNFALKIPLFVTQLAYAENGKVKFAAIFDPVHNELFFAEKNKGSYLNNKKIKCSSKTDFNFSQGSIAGGLVEKELTIYKKISQMVGNDFFWVRNFGSTGIHGSLTARAGLDWTLTTTSKVWDYAPASLLITEAGGIVKNLSGKDWQLSDDSMIGGNPILVKKLLRILK